MLHNFVKGLFNRFIGDDPLKRFYVLWAVLLAGLIIVTAVILSPLAGARAEVDRQTKTLEPQKRQLQSLNITPATRDVLLAQFMSALEREAATYISPLNRPLIISEISALAGTHDVTIDRINFLDDRPIKEYEKSHIVPIRMSVTGEFEKVGNFFGHIEDMVNYFFTWDNVSLTDGGTPDGTVRADIVMAFYSRT